MGTAKKICWLVSLIAGLTAVLAPGQLLAQDEKTDMVLRMSGDYFRTVTPGHETTLFLEVGNLGTRTLTNIRFYTDRPEDWSVEFRPSSIERLAPGSFQTLDVIIRPADGLSERDNSVTLIAEANETRRVLSVFLRIETGPSIWLWIGIATAVLVVAGFVVIFLRFGRNESPKL